MKFLGTAFLRGLAIVLPVLLTVYLVYFTASSLEFLAGNFLRWLLPAGNYLPGVGLVLALLAITLLGMVMQLPGMNGLVTLSDALFSRIPLVKSVYTTIKDLVGFVAEARRSEDTGRPVLVKLTDEMEVVGLVTDNQSTLGGSDTDRVLVYLPMSYQIGGYTVSIARERITPLDMSVEDALRFVVTAGVRGHTPAPAPTQDR